VSRPEETIDKAEAGCQLLLFGPPRFDPARLAEDLDVALTIGGIAGFVLCLDDPEAGILAAPVRAVCARHGIAFLVRGDVATALEVGVDGVHIRGGGADVAATRAALESKRILGVSCGHSRDAAMVAGEAGADYVGFGAPDQPPGQEVYDLLEWWSELSVLPCLAEVAAAPEDCERLARAGADFVAAGPAIWTHPDRLATALRRLKEALQVASRGGPHRIGFAPGDRLR
jgi:thiamine-phosphate pyrophosphorylase